MFQWYKEKYAIILAAHFEMPADQVLSWIEIPPVNIRWDLAFPCFKLSSALRSSPPEIAKKYCEILKEKALPSDLFADFVVEWWYINALFSPGKITQDTLSAVFQQKEGYGALRVGEWKKVLVEYSSPNIAKPFSVWHLRSTVIGSALAHMHDFAWYDVVRLNHLGDWWTQFGKLIVAYKLRGEETKLLEDPIKYLLTLYVRFHQEVENDASLEEKAREAFKLLEEGNKEYLALREQFKTLSLQKFAELYVTLWVHFDAQDGEAFYNDKLNSTLDTLESKIKSVFSQWAQIIDLAAYDMPPFMLKKSDGASTYHLRDLAAVFYRLQTYHPDKILYVVGTEQTLHFQQLFTVLGLAGYETEKFVHVDFWLFRFKDEKMSTRKWNVVFLEDVFSQAFEKAKILIDQKNPNLPNKEQVAHQVAVGALIFGDLINDRTKFIDFDLDKMISFEGETGPYVQYTHARCQSIIKKANLQDVLSKRLYGLLNKEEEKQIVLHLAQFSDLFGQALREYKPSVIARYILDLAHLFNHYYGSYTILETDIAVKEARVALVAAVQQVLKNWLALLGIAAPEEM